ncbi:hypothetical protein CTAYLR_009789 [Chrysophaeum taylorii]|uniref:RRM domain-containing protein n=1 Tax=Chrysophaeum taylorii TaxID=2483200 RepID=A0AAD7UFK9_9STRA|nr:hypothetical protein CTAYLR_009789 [Chrysophaeum taylorii]
MEGSNKRILYVGGLADEVVEETVHAAFIPFGDIVEVNIPRDGTKEKGNNRGFGFVEFESEADADEARFNMNGSELFGRVLRVNVAKPSEHRLGSSKPVWSADEWFRRLQPGEDDSPPADAAAATKEGPSR